jgi:hypothetical protein
MSPVRADTPRRSTVCLHLFLSIARRIERKTPPFLLIFFPAAQYHLQRIGQYVIRKHYFANNQ